MCVRSVAETNGRKSLTSQVAADDSLQRDDLCFLHKHRSAIKLVLVLPDLLRHLVDVGRDEVCRDDVLELVEPEEGYLRQDLPLVWYALYASRRDRARADKT